VHLRNAIRASVSHHLVASVPVPRAFSSVRGIPSRRIMTWAERVTNAHGSRLNLNPGRGNQRTTAPLGKRARDMLVVITQEIQPITNGDSVAQRARRRICRGRLLRHFAAAPSTLALPTRALLNSTCRSRGDAGVRWILPGLRRRHRRATFCAYLAPHTTTHRQSRLLPQSRDCFGGR